MAKLTQAQKDAYIALILYKNNNQHIKERKMDYVSSFKR